MHQVIIYYLLLKKPVSTSVYTWSTLTGHILGYNSDSTAITVDSAGKYVVTQKLQAGCSTYATDTVVIFYNSSCFTLNNKLLRFTGNLFNKKAQLNWSVSQSSQIAYFKIERSTDGIHFISTSTVLASPDNTTIINYTAKDNPAINHSRQLYYRLKIIGIDGSVTYSKTLAFTYGEPNMPSIKIAPNPVKDVMQLKITSLTDNKLQLFFYDVTGRFIKTINTNVNKGNSTLTIEDFMDWPAGIYSVKLLLGENLFTEKMILAK